MMKMMKMMMMMMICNDRDVCDDVNDCVPIMQDMSSWQLRLGTMMIMIVICMMTMCVMMQVVRTIMMTIIMIVLIMMVMTIVLMTTDRQSHLFNHLQLRLGLMMMLN